MAYKAKYRFIGADGKTVNAGEVVTGTPQYLERLKEQGMLRIPKQHTKPTQPKETKPANTGDIETKPADAPRRRGRPPAKATT